MSPTLRGAVATALVVTALLLAPSVSKAAHPELRLRAELTDDHHLVGEAAWRIENDGPKALAALHFLLFPNSGARPNPELSTWVNAEGYFNAFDPSATEIDGVTDASDRPLRFRLADAPATLQTVNLDRGMLVVELSEPLAPGGHAIVSIRFRTRVPHRRYDMGHFNGTTTWRFGWFPIPRHRDAGGWSDAVVLVAFTHETELTVPEGLTAIVGADEAHQHGRYVAAWSKIPVRSVPLVVGDRFRSATETVDGVDVTVYVRPDYAVSDPAPREIRRTFEQVRAILPFYRERYGAYRLKTLHVAESAFPGGMAADGLVLLGDVFFVYDSSWMSRDIAGPLGENVLAHEIAHQWFGIGLGADFDAYNWLSESFSNYLSLEYAEAQTSLADRGDMLDPSWFVFWLYGSATGQRLPSRQLEHVIEPSYENHVEFGVDTRVSAPQRSREHAEEAIYAWYEKGYLVTRALEALLGQQGMSRTLRRLYTERAGEIIDTATLVRTALDETKVDVGPLMAAFVEGRATFDAEALGLEIEEHGGRFRSKLRVRREGELPLPVVVRLAGDGEQTETVWGGRDGAGELVVETPWRPHEVVLDPGRQLPDTNRRNNTWPRSTRFQWFAVDGDSAHRNVALDFLPGPNHILGLGVNVAEGSDSLWRLGGGLLGAGAHTGGDAYFVWGARASYTRPTDRGSVLFTRLAATRAYGLTGEPFATAEGEVGHGWSLFEETKLGATGRTELPRTYVELFGRVRGVAVDGGDSTQLHVIEPEDRPPEPTDPLGLTAEGSDDVLERGTGTVVVRVARDDTVRTGFLTRLELEGGLTGARPETFAQGSLRTGWRTVLPWVGRLFVGGGVAAITDHATALDRPPLEHLRAPWLDFGDRPYDALAEAGVRLRVPLIRDLRMANALTLGGLFVLDDLSLEAHYGLAAGGHWRSDGSLARSPDTSEVGLGVVFGLGFILADHLDVAVTFVRCALPCNDLHRDEYGVRVSLGVE